MVAPAHISRAIALVLPVLPLLLSGCGPKFSANPTDWWHNLEGGRIAEERPPPPGVNDPYPNLARVPAKPTPPDKAAMQSLTNALIADRRNAQYTADSAPLADPSSQGASPGRFGGSLPPPAPRPPSGSANMSMPAISTPAAPPTPPTPASRKPVTSEALDMPAVPPAPPPAAPETARKNQQQQEAAAQAAAQTPAQPTGSQLLTRPEQIPAAPPQLPPEDSGPLPALPTGVPAAPSVAGKLPSAAGSAAPSKPPVTANANTVPVGFPLHSAALSADAQAALKQIATSRANRSIAITGYGDARSSDTTGQTAALSLGLSRAQAIANALKANGVPESAILIGTQAEGRGASLRLLQ